MPSSLVDLLTMALETSRDALRQLYGREALIEAGRHPIYHQMDAWAAACRCDEAAQRLGDGEPPSHIAVDLRGALLSACAVFGSLQARTTREPGQVAEILDQSNILALCQLAMGELDREMAREHIFGLIGS